MANTNPQQVSDISLGQNSIITPRKGHCTRLSPPLQITLPHHLLLPSSRFFLHLRRCRMMRVQYEHKRGHVKWLYHPNSVAARSGEVRDVNEAFSCFLVIVRCCQYYTTSSDKEKLTVNGGERGRCHSSFPLIPFRDSPVVNDQLL